MLFKAIKTPLEQHNWDQMKVCLWKVLEEDEHHEEDL
jgi:hypothetical protein